VARQVGATIRVAAVLPPLPLWRPANRRLVTLRRQSAVHSIHQLENGRPGATALDPYLHHCCSHGTPSLFPSILVPGQFLRK